MSVYDAAWYEVVEAEHEFQNPVSRDTIVWVGQKLGLGRPVSLGWSRRVLDVGCGTCGPAIVLAQEFHCRLTCVDLSREFLRRGWERIEEAHVDALITIEHADANERAFGEYDAAICLGASFVFGGLLPTVHRLFEHAPAIAIGEPYTDLAQTVGMLRAMTNLEVDVATSSEDDWDEYESQRMLTLDGWLEEHPDAHSAEMHARERAAQARRRDEMRGWGIFVCRKLPE